jgi:hypothetical protein
MESLISFVTYGVGGFFGLIGLLFVLAFLFGKRIDTKWEYEAKFRDARGRELGEFEIELSRVEEDVEQDYTLEASFDLRHPALESGRIVQVHLNDVLVMQGVVETQGRIRLRGEHLKDDIKSPAAGQICVVQCAGQELFAEELYAD